MEYPRYLSFCDWLISLSIMSSRFMCVVPCARIPLFLSLHNVYHWKMLLLFKRLETFNHRHLVNPLRLDPICSPSSSFSSLESLTSRGSTSYQTDYQAKKIKYLLSIYIAPAVLHSTHPFSLSSIPLAESKGGRYLGNREEGKSSRSLLCNSWNSSNVRWI